MTAQTATIETTGGVLEVRGMDVILKTNAAVEQVRQAFDGNSDRPRPEWVRGVCPDCGDDLVSNCYYVGGRGYLVLRECWSALGKNPTCTYSKVL